MHGQAGSAMTAAPRPWSLKAPLAWEILVGVAMLIPYRSSTLPPPSPPRLPKASPSPPQKPSIFLRNGLAEVTIRGVGDHHTLLVYLWRTSVSKKRSRSYPRRAWLAIRLRIACSVNRKHASKILVPYVDFATRHRSKQDTRPHAR